MTSDRRNPNPAETPQQRHERLQRAVAAGETNDALWLDLAETCHALGRRDEAEQCVQRIADRALQEVGARRLERLDAGQAGAARTTTDDDGAPALREHVVDAFQYLFHQQMPMLVLLATLSFPLIVGVGGVLTAGGSPLLLAAISAVPGLCILTIVGAMGRQILLASAEGNGDVPPVPAGRELLHAASSFFVDATLVLTALVGAPIAAVYLGAPWWLWLPWLAVGATVAPMAWSLRQLHGDIACLSPVRLLRQIWRTRTSYFGLAGATATLFLPTATAAWQAFGTPLWVQIASIGPVCALPLFVASRLIGTWLDVHRDAFRSEPTAEVAADEAAATAAATSPTATPAVAAPTSLRQPRLATAAAPGKQRRQPALRSNRRAVLAADGSITFADATADGSR